MSGALRLLGCALISPEFAARLVSAVGLERVDLFEDLDHRALYRVIHERTTHGLDLAPDLVALDYRRTGGIQDGVVPAAIWEAPNALGADELLDGELERWRRRRVKRFLAKCGEALDDPIVAVETGIRTVEDVLAATQRETIALTASDTRRVREADSFRAEAERYAAIQRGERVASWPWGVGPLDAVAGIEPGTLTILAGLSKHGKTRLAIHLAVGLLRAGVPVLHLPLEAGWQGTWKLYVSRWLGLDSRLVGRPDMAPETIDVLRGDADGLYEAPLSMEDAAGLTSRELVARIREWWIRRGLDYGVAVIDFLQLCTDRGDSRAEVLTRVAYSLAEVAVRESGLAVVALAQLNRLAERDGHSTAEHLEGSGGIQQAAQSVVVIDSLYMRAVKRRVQEGSESGDRPDPSDAAFAAHVVNRGDESGTASFRGNLRCGWFW